MIAVKNENSIHGKYSEIYKKVYWSGFRPNDSTYSKEIINNRNKFIEEFDIVKVDTTNTLYRISDALQNDSIIKDLVDHLEFYRTKSGGVVILNSPYGAAINECPGMEPYAKMYSPDANTFIKCLDTLKHAKEWSKALLAK